MKRKPMLFAAAVLSAMLLLLAWAFAPRPVEVELAQATLGDFESTIEEDARTRLAERYVVSAPLAGRLQRITLREGDAVPAGAVVAMLNPVLSPLLDERARLEQGARVAAAGAAVLQAGARVEGARVALQRAQVELRRTEQLSQQGFVSPSRIDGERLAAQAAQRELDAAVHGERISGHELELARAALRAVNARAPVIAFPLRAPVAGRVLRLHHTSEATVALGVPLMEIGDTTRLEIVAELLTADALQAHPGSAVRIERWGGPGVLSGRVRSVEPAAFTKVSALGVEEQRVNVIIDLTSPHEAWAMLGDGYRVAVSIVTQRMQGVLRVPVSAVFPLPSDPAEALGGSAVFVAEGGRARLQKVAVGARSGSLAWVREGLSAGTRVVVYPSAAVADGVRIRGKPV